MKALLIAIFLTLSQASLVYGQESEWLSVSSNNNGTVWYIRSSYLNNSTDYNPVVWIKMDHKGDKTIMWRTTMALHKFDCKNMKYFTASIIKYHADGRVKESSDYSHLEYRGGFSYAPPESMIEGAMIYACP